MPAAVDSHMLLCSQRPQVAKEILCWDMRLGQDETSVCVAGKDRNRESEGWRLLAETLQLSAVQK